MITTTTTPTTEAETAKFDRAALTRNLPYTLCNQDGTPLGPRKLKFIEKEIAAGRTYLIFLLASNGKDEEHICKNLYYSNLVIFHLMYRQE